MPDDISIPSVTALDDEAAGMLELRVRIRNSAKRTMHVCSSVRAVRYDPATKTLEVQLSDRGLQELSMNGTFSLPTFQSVDPEDEIQMTVSVPRTIARFVPGTNEIAPVIEELPAHEAETIDVEIAYSGTPFYRDPRRRPDNSPRAMVVAWAEGHATYHGPLSKEGAGRTA
jgi:hypothetical protein